MYGIAQKLYRESTNQQPWKLRPKKHHQAPWPFLESLLDKGLLSYVDYALAEAVLRPYPVIEEAAAALVCYLSLAVRAGHLCAAIDLDAITPSPESLWKRKILKEGMTLESEDMEGMLSAFRDRVQEGARLLPCELLYREGEEPFTNKPICQRGRVYYFQKYWHYETAFIEHLQRIESTPSLCPPDAQLVDEELARLLGTSKVLPEQAEAIRKGCLNNFSIICGGPGTGKTYTAGILIKTYLSSLPPEKRSQCKIALAAPTGKAASNLQKSLSRACGAAAIPPAQTLHSLLQIGKKSSFNSKSSIAADLILVDESSMIDAHLITKLFAAVRPGAKLILLGDPHQLPPVESGLFFGDLVDESKSSGKIQVAALKKCLRAELETIVDAAAAINTGNTALFSTIVQRSAVDETISCLFYDPAYSPFQLQKELLAKILRNIPSAFSMRHNHRELLDLFNRYKVLSPLRKGPFGVDTLNNLIRESLAKALPSGEPLIAPILVVSNNSRLELCNGETGILIKNNSKEGRLEKGDMVIFPSSVPGGEPRVLPALLLPKFEYAYCMSIHKSQGSEFDELFVLLPEGSEIFGREILYTAVTRAKKKLEIWSTEKTLKATIEQHSKRHSSILDRLALSFFKPCIE